METKGTILSYRPDVRVVDATIRDGGLVNDFRFTDEFVKNLYKANIKAGVDYMEFGYKASSDIFPKADSKRLFFPSHSLLQWQFYLPFLT